MSIETLSIVPIPAFEDNYIWLLHNRYDAVVIDPGDAQPVIDMLEKHSLKLRAILITHHHSDHIGGVETLIEQFSPQVYAPQYEQYPFQHISLSAGDQITLAPLKLSFEVLWLPGHTLGHIAYVNADYLFCGDVLFGAGCGRLFEGTPEQMLQSLKQLKTLSAGINVYCTHEYTAHNINFALTLEPDNLDLQQRKADVEHLRQQMLPSLPSTVDLELRTNPFLRCTQTSIIENSHADKEDELSVFSKIRALRNHY